MSLLDTAKAKISAARRALSSAGQSVATIRAEIARLQTERQAIAAAPLPPDEARPVLDTATDRLFHAVRPQIAGLDDFIEAAANGRPLDLRHTSGEVKAALMALEPVIRARLEEELQHFYAHKQPGLPAGARQARLREIDAELLSLEREEESMLAELAGAGLVLDRRPDVDPRAFFEETAG